MRFSMKIPVAAAATLLVAPQLATADEIEAQLRAMDERMGQLERQLQATQDELAASKETVAAQQEVIERAGLERQARSGLSAFLSRTRFSGLVAASWNWNFNNPNNTAVSTANPDFADGPSGGAQAPGTDDVDVYRVSTFGGGLASGFGTGVNNGNLGFTAPLHSNHNSFQVDQVWLSMMKPATVESRGGWGVDLVWGAAADRRNLGENGQGFDTDVGASGDWPHLYQAYAEYLMPIGSGVYVKAGRWDTLIGAETLRADKNFNVTRGLLWTIQPENHTGIVVGGDCDFGLTWALAAANSYSDTMADADRQKTFIGRIGYRGETFSLLVNGLYGGDVSDFFATDGFAQIFGPGTSEDRIGMIDMVARWDPIENFSMWINFDWYTFDWADTEKILDRLHIYALAAAARLAVTDRTGVAFRYEWLLFQDNPFEVVRSGVDIDFGDPVISDIAIQSITGTLDYALTDNLTALAELRYDWASRSDAPDYFFITHENLPEDPDFYAHRDQLLGLLQLLYRF